MDEPINMDRSPVVLPQELADMIADYCRTLNDTSALVACSLVSREWLAASRRHLFHTLCIAGDPGVAGFSRFSDFLNGTPYVRRYVRELRLYSRPARSNIARITMAELRSILERLPRLRALELRRIEIISSGAVESLPYPIDRLQLAEIHISGPAWIVLTTLSNSGVQDLRVASFYSNRPNESLAVAHLLPSLKLRSLTLSAASFELLHFARSCVASVNTLRCVVDPSNVGSLGGLIKQVGQNLSRFEFEIKWFESPNAVDWGLLNLSHCSALHTVVVYWGPHDGRWELRLNVIAALPLTLRELILEFVGYEDLAGLPCWKLEQMLDNFLKLKRVVFWSSPRSTAFNEEIPFADDEPAPDPQRPEELRNKLNFVLPKLHNRGLLAWDMNASSPAPSDYE